jgi:hypothetical protein
LCADSEQWKIVLMHGRIAESLRQSSPTLKVKPIL